ncbi:hypothetical protein [Mucilaginibacter gotjawali]|uniref:Uncharacterized protein n=2 Tax=Mucilaginibacter gotjawali TaxID=1550579 RepID=A0A839S7P8_9SPHI|nr:hypothetical protein [Mucilaginibacter gotjawali]MBB3053915.1 hypothetical protein [Mucilaginibacter gotjawali]BAU54179.1 hypothetical protein MgSA37_02351 [Mucilaginibacter gotjawali]
MKLTVIRVLTFSLFFITIGQQLSAQGKQGYLLASVKISPSANASYPASPAIAKDNDELKVLADLENSFNKKPSRKLLLSFLRELNNKPDIDARQRGSKLNLHLARLFAKLRLYPLVMKCYFKNNVPGDDIYRKGYFIKQHVAGSDSVKMMNDSLDNTGLLAINSRDSILLKTDSGFYNHDGKNIQSAPVESVDIINPFEDGKTGVKYALLVHIQQPKSGRPKIFIRLNKVGHTFITLIKYNSDSTYVARTFGFYPDKESFLSATPIFPSADPLFKNDERHDFDEVVGKFISKRRFQKILQLVKQYNSHPYNLNNNNCTDFGLDAATIGGINILDTYGKWPLGRGNNPAKAGMSVLEGKVVNSDTEDGGLFIYNDVIEDK